MISVLVVDDSVVVRRLITDALSADPDITVVGTASNGRIALAKVEELKPDIITLDIEMPVLDGLGTLRELRRNGRRLPVIMFSTLTAAGASATLEALAAGASDYVTKPANVGSVTESIRSVREQLIPRIHALCGRRLVRRPGVPPGRTAPPSPRPLGTRSRPTGPVLPGRGPAVGTSPAAGPAARAETAPPHPAAPRAPGGTSAAPRPAQKAGRIDVIAIASSTGGPDALTRMLSRISADLPVPIVVVQHMPPIFTKMFAERLDRSSPLHVVEAVGDTPLAPGTVYIAPGDHHLEVTRRAASVVTRLHDGPVENSCRPSADVLFRSVAAIYGRSALGLVLTGMGKDGWRGSEVLSATGAEIAVQDEASSVVWGMPGAVATAGLATVVLPLDEIAEFVQARAWNGRAAKLAGVR